MQLTDSELIVWNKYQADVQKMIGKVSALSEQIKQKDEIIEEYRKMCSSYKELIQELKAITKQQQELIIENLKQMFKDLQGKSEELTADCFKQYFDEELSEKLAKLLESEVE